VNQEMICPCGSEKQYDQCCGKIHKSGKAQTAVELMRARYSAYVLGEIGFVGESHDPAKRSEFNPEEAATWSSESEWGGLTILATDKGEAKDSEGMVEFVARYYFGKEWKNHRERAIFKKIDGKWFYHDGVFVDSTIKREEAKVGRNDPCPCGSGKKYKKCCG